MIEILVVIGIIIVLVGIVAVGVTGIGRGAQETAGGVVMQNAKAMITELETATGLSGLPGPGAVVAPGVVTLEAWNASNATDTNLNGRYLAPAVVQTQVAMGKLLAVPNNRRALQQLPPEQILKGPGADGVPIPTTPLGAVVTPGGTADPNPQILADPWGNPVIFVPAGGLLIVHPSYNAADQYRKGHYVLDGTTTYRALKDNKGVATSDTSAWEEVPAIPNRVRVSPDGRPFFASAGPDGDFLGADDNLYSFEN